MIYRVQDMTRLQVAERIRQYPVAIVPIGSTEQHGPHLPLGTDVFLAEKLAELVSDETGALVFPSLNFGYSWGWRDIAGTVSLQREHFQIVLTDIVKSVERYGVQLLIFLNGHEANGSSMKYAIRDVSDDTSMKILGMFYPGLGEVYEKYMESPTWGGMFHACEFETSLMLSADESKVNMQLACKEYPPRPDFYGMDDSSIGEISKSGVYGDPTLATKEKGDRMFAEFTRRIVEIIHKAYPCKK